MAFNKDTRNLMKWLLQQIHYPPPSHYEPAYYYSPDLIQPRHEFPNSIRLQQPPNTASPFTVEEALYVLGKNILGKNVTDRIFPVAKTIAKGVGQVGQGLSTFGELIPPVEFDGSPLKLLPGRKIKRAYINYRIVWKTTRTKYVN